MGTRGDAERAAAQRERDAAAVERVRAEKHDGAEAVHRSVEARHLQAAQLHDRAAVLFDAHDDPSVAEAEATAIADEVITGVDVESISLPPRR